MRVAAPRDPVSGGDGIRQPWDRPSQLDLEHIPELAPCDVEVDFPAADPRRLQCAALNWDRFSTRLCRNLTGPWFEARFAAR